MLIDYLRIHHLLGHKHLLLPTLCNVSGMAFCGLLASKSQWDQFYYYYYHNNILAARRIKRMIGYTALVDLVSGMCLTFGLLLTGGAMFVVLYNSCPVWTAILSRFILKQSLNKAQIMSVVMVSIGLVMNVLVNSTSTSSSSSSTNQAAGGGQEHKQTLDHQSVIQEEHHQFSIIMMVGSIVVLIGSLLHSLMFVLSDMSMMSIMHQLNHMESNLFSNPECSSKNSIEMDGKDKDKDGIPGEIWSCCLGTLEVVFMMVWVAFGILLSGFDDEDTRLDTEEDGIQYNGIDYNRFLKVMLGLMTLTTVSCLHAASFFKLLKNLGAVASALLKGVQAVVVVMLSAILYCPLESSQCLTWSKFFSMMIVILGVFGYGLGSRKKHDTRIMNPLVNSRSNMDLSHRPESESLIERF